MDEKDLTVSEAARRLGIHPNTLRQWVDRGLVQAVKLPGSGFRRFRPGVIEQLRRDMEAGTLEGKAVA